MPPCAYAEGAELGPKQRAHELQLAVLEKRNGTWEARYEDAGETQQQVAALEKYISQFVEQQKPDAAAEASKIDVNKVLSGEQQVPETSPTPDIPAGSDAPRFAAKQAKPKPAGEAEILPWEDSPDPVG
jgi:hypothetical protein